MIDNVYYYVGADTTRTPRAQGATLEPDIAALLDHVAVELAAEYVRLMEAAAEADGCSPTTDDD